MAALDFPSSPSNGQTYTANGLSYTWDGTAWRKGSSIEVVPSGSRMIFHQASAPSGWTKSTTNNDRALRVISGSTGGQQGGDYAFSARLNSTVTTGGGAVQSHILSQAQMPSHYHYAFRSGNHGQLRNGTNMSANNYPGSGSGAGNLYESYNISASNSAPDVGRTSSHVVTAGGSADQGHGHGFTQPGFNLAVHYTDVIICQKD